MNTDKLPLLFTRVLQWVGSEPEWTRAQALENLCWNKETYLEKKVEARYNGLPLVLP